MIEELHIRGLGVIEDTSLVLGPGLTVVTGETGAGKTMLVTALQLLLGARATTDLVRRGESAAIIEAVVRPPAPDAAVRARSMDGVGTGGDDDLPDGWDLAEDGVLIVSREIPVEGRSRARVGGRLVPTATLQALLGPLIEIHGQHEHTRLEHPAVQRAALDAFGGSEHAALLAAHRTAYDVWSGAVRRARLVREDAEARVARLELLRAEREAIDAVAPDPERDGRLDEDIDRLANADALREALEGAHAAAGSSGALESIGSAVSALRRAPGADTVLLGLVDSLRGTSRDLSEIVADLARAAEDVESDDVRLDALQARKRALTPLLRRFGPDVADVIAHRGAVQASIDELESLEADADAVDAAVDEARAALDRTGEALRTSRTALGERLSGMIAPHLAALGLPHAVLNVALQPLDEPTADGVDRIDLLLAANPGESPVRLADAASGGERSRVALALGIVLTDGQEQDVLVFDEVDAGVGGSTALAVGEKLATLAHGRGDRTRQVLCVTHLAQVAAFADDHLMVEKHVVGGRTVTQVRRVEQEERATELSRMLGGEATAEAGIEHARGLLRAAGQRGPVGTGA